MINPFKTISNYSEMLNKIAFCTFIVVLCMIYFLSQEISQISDFTSKWSLQITALGIEMPFGILAPSFIIALLFRIVRLHDRLSDFFNIRKEFEYCEIIHPMIIRSGAMFHQNNLGNLDDRRYILNQIFYKYASTTDEKRLLDKHLVDMALDTWSWYWIILEAQTVFISSATIFAFFEIYKYAFWLTYISLSLFLVTHFLYNQCKNRAQDQVVEILSNADYKQTICHFFRDI